MLKNNTVILLFARSLSEELKHKPFLAQQSLIHKLHNHTEHIANQSGLPVFVYDETKQVGRNFGERYTNALEHIFNMGYGHIITIGNDCPQLNIEHINKAKNALLNEKVSIGETYDGGFYLLGISKELFDKNTFLNFKWQSNTLFKEITSYFNFLSIEYSTLTKLRDVDYYSDLKHLSLRYIKDETLRNSILSVISKQDIIHFSKKLKVLLIPQQVVFNKGSPLEFSF